MIKTISHHVFYIVMSNNVAALQLTSQLVRIDRRKSVSGDASKDKSESLGSRAFIVRAAMNVRGVAVSDTHLAVWNGTQAQVFELGDMAAEQVCVQTTPAKVCTCTERERGLLCVFLPLYSQISVF